VKQPGNLCRWYTLKSTDNVPFFELLRGVVMSV